MDVPSGTRPSGFRNWANKVKEELATPPSFEVPSEIYESIDDLNDRIDGLALLRSLDEIDPVIVTLDDETHSENDFFGGGLGIHVIEVTHDVGTYRDLYVRPDGDVEAIVCLSDPREAMSLDAVLNGWLEPETWDEDLWSWTVFFEANTVYYVTLFSSSWDPPGAQIDIGPMLYGLEQPSRTQAVRELLSPIAIGSGQHAFAVNSAVAQGKFSFAAGGSEATGLYAFASGFATKATGVSAHAMGDGSEAIGDVSHAEGSYTVAESDFSHAEGINSRARWRGSHASAAGMFTSIGDAQYERVVIRSSGAARLWVSPNVNHGTFPLPEGYVSQFRGMIVTRVPDGSESKCWEIKGLISTVGTPSFVGSPSIDVVAETAGAAGWNASIEINIGTNSNQQRSLGVTPIGVPFNARNVATLEFVEVG